MGYSWVQGVVAGEPKLAVSIYVCEVRSLFCCYCTLVGSTLSRLSIALGFVYLLRVPLSAHWIHHSNQYKFFQSCPLRFFLFSYYTHLPAAAICHTTRGVALNYASHSTGLPPFNNTNYSSSLHRYNSF